MSNHPPHSHNPNPAPDEAKDTAIPEDQLKSFWLKNEKTIYIVCLIVILAVGGYSFIKKMHSDSDAQVGVEYAVANTPEKLRAFITANPDHPLAAAAELRLADDAYTAKNYAEAATAYDKAAAKKDSPFAARARLGAAVSKIYAGQTADGETRLNQLANDNTQPAVIRAEAAYHLATLAASAGRTADASKFYDQVGVIAPASIWAQNAAMQRQRVGSATLTLPAATTTQPAITGTTTSELPSVSFPQ